MRGIALLYLGLLLVLPVAMVFIRAFENGLDPVIQAIARPAFQSAFWLTVQITLITVPVCTVMGVITALALTRRRFPGLSLLNALVDLPFALSPVVIGLSLFLVYGTNSPIGGCLADHGITVIFAVPGMVLATIFVCLPFVIREVVPVLREIGTDQEKAAYTLGAGPIRTFWRVTLPAIRWAIVYGIILTTARSLGEFGAVAIVSGKISGKTITPHHPRAGAIRSLRHHRRIHRVDRAGRDGPPGAPGDAAVSVGTSAPAARSRRRTAPGACCSNLYPHRAARPEDTPDAPFASRD